MSDTRVVVALNIAQVAWNLADGHNYAEARLSYAVANGLLPRGHIDADLSLLRHTVGDASGYVEAIEATEDQVWSVWLRSAISESPTPDGMSSLGGSDLAKNIEAFIEWFNPGFHRRNVVQDRSHIMVMSTGRCGTMALFKLFQNDAVLRPHHNYWFTMPLVSHMEMLCRLVSGRFEGGEQLYADWLSCRAAEWLGGRMIGLNHMDTIFAPVFAAMHPESKFVYLRRDSKAVAASFYSKRQWQGQIQPLDYAFDPGFRFHIPTAGAREKIDWYVHFTEVFCRAMIRVMPARCIEISADRLFAQDREEIAKLLKFTGSDIDLDVAVEHFATKINEKAHKAA